MPPDDDLLSLIIAHTRARPSAPALIGPEESLDYAALGRRTAVLAAGLTTAGVLGGDRVALRIENSVAFVTTALACMWLGAPFVPISVEDPEARANRALADCSPRVVVTWASPAAPPTAPPSPASPPSSPVPGPSSAAPETPGSVTYEQLLELGAGHDLGSEPATTSPDQLAYIIYTSGTTGAPKGVSISRGAMSWSVREVARSLHYGPASRSLAVSAFHFDGSYSNLFSTLRAGGLLVIPRRQDLLFLRPFFDTVVQHEITHTTFSPSYLRLLLASRHLSRLAGSRLAVVGLGGEELVGSDLRRLWAAAPGTRVFSLYGPTECTISVTGFEITPEALGRDRVPLGTPNEGVGFHIVDEAGEEVVDGRLGELYISGRQLMAGYWGDAAQSRAVLTRGVVPGLLCYRTGDLVFRDSDGLYFYVGRRDDVIKRNGVRISLSEVAGALGQVPGVRAAACALFRLEDRPGIVAFVVGDKTAAQCPHDGARLLQELRQQLPPTMIPDQVHFVPELPLTSSGKIDRPRLLSEVGLEPAR